MTARKASTTKNLSIARREAQADAPAGLRSEVRTGERVTGGRTGPRGRYAPSPTGRIHLGNARTALVAWLSIRSQTGTFVWRLEDIDTSRVVPGMAEEAIEDLAWLGLDWDEGGDRGGPHAPYVQSQRHELYEQALLHLLERGRLFPCCHSRKDLQELASAPHGNDHGIPAYPASLRPRVLPDNWFHEVDVNGQQTFAIRFRVLENTVTFQDAVYGEMAERVDLSVGDFVLKRRDGVYAYQLAVVVDDWLMDIREVVRGADLLSSTARQIQLFEALGVAPPRYAHVPLIRNASGEKLSKRDAGLTLRTLRERGIASQQVVGYLAWTLGLLEAPSPCHPSTLIERFSWSAVPREDHILQDDVESVLRRITAE